MCVPFIPNQSIRIWQNILYRIERDEAIDETKSIIIMLLGRGFLSPQPLSLSLRPPSSCPPAPFVGRMEREHVTEYSVPENSGHKHTLHTYRMVRLQEIGKYGEQSIAVGAFVAVAVIVVVVDHQVISRKLTTASILISDATRLRRYRFFSLRGHN